MAKLVVVYDERSKVEIRGAGRPTAANDTLPRTAHQPLRDTLLCASMLLRNSLVNVNAN